VHRDVAGARRDLEGAVGTAVDRAEAAFGRGCEPRRGTNSGMRSLLALTTPPMACDP